MAHHLEQQQSLVVSEMFTDGAIATPVLHITFLAFTVVMKDALVIPEITVPVLLASLAGKQNDKRTP
jgi:hypothetical protein